MKTTIQLNEEDVLQFCMNEVERTPNLMKTLNPKGVAGKLWAGKTGGGYNEQGVEVEFRATPQKRSKRNA